MTLTEIAKKYHVSPQAVRNRIQRAGFTLADIRRPGSNQLSADGERIIIELFEEKAARQQKGTAGKAAGNQGGKAPSGSGGQLAIIRAERDELRIKTATAEALAAERQKTIEYLQAQIREKDATISKLAAAAAVKAALPEPAPAQDPGQDKPKKRFKWPWQK